MSLNENNMFVGVRGVEFKNFIVKLLKRGKLKTSYLNLLIDETGMELYDQAFTSITCNEETNYEMFEQIGDVTANKFIVWYMHRRFPQLNCTLGVKVVARLRINYGARQTFSVIADDLGFWNYISASCEERGHRKKDLLEDCFESFIGVTEYILDQRIRHGVGYAITYDILSSVFDQIDISLKYEDLYDAKTRLKELFDLHSDLGTWVFKDVRGEKLANSTVYLVPKTSCKTFLPNKTTRPEWVLIGQGSAAKQKDAQQHAAQKALNMLNQKGYIKHVPKEYSEFVG